MDSYALQYHFSFLEAYPQSVGANPYRYKVSFLREGFTGVAQEILPSGSPLEIEWSESGDNIFTPILPQKFTVNLACQDYWQGQDFYVSDPFELQILIEVDYTGTGTDYNVLRRGWVQATDFEEDYGAKPYYISVSAACGLSLLKDIPLLDSAGKRLQGMVSLSHVMRTALAHTNTVDHLISGINLFEESDMARGQNVENLVSSGKDPLYQVTFNSQLLLTDKNEPISCHDALILCSTQLQVRITQHNGKWYALRVPDMPGGNDPWNGVGAKTIHIRQHYDVDPSAPPFGQFDQSIDLNVTASNVGTLRVKGDGPNTRIPRRQNGIRIEQSFGRFLSRVPNADLSQVDNTNFPVGWNKRNVDANTAFRAGTGTEADPYRIVIKGGGDEKVQNNTGAVSFRIEFNPASKDYTRFNKRTVKFQFRLTNTRAAKVFAVEYRDNGPYLMGGNGLFAFSKLKKSDSVGKLFYNTRTDANGHEVSKPGWADAEFDLGTIDHVLAIEMYFARAELLDYYAPGNTTPDMVEYRNFQIITEQEGLNLNGQQRTIVKPGQTVKDTTLSISLGDVPDAAQPTDRIGTLFKRTSTPGSTPTTRWYKPDWTILPNGTPANNGTPKPLIDWLAQDYARQFMFPAPGFEGTLIGRMLYGPLSVLHISDEPKVGPGILTRWSWKLRECEHEVTSQRLMADSDLSTLPAPAKEWQTPDGPVLMNVGEDGQPVEPTPKPSFRPEVKFLRDLQNAGVFPPGIKPHPFVPGYTAVLPNEPKFGAIPIVGGKRLGLVPSILRKQFNLTLIPG